MERRVHNSVLILVFMAWLASPVAGWAAEWERWQLKMGVAYEEGDFGTDVTTRALFIPFTIRYLGERFDLGLTTPFIYQDSSEAVTLVDGELLRIEEEGDPAEALSELAPGLGDLVMKGRLYLFDDPGSSSPLPGLASFVKVKFPTANETEGLGTGEFDLGFGVEFDKQIRDFSLFADAGYTFIGEPPGTDLRNRISAGVGVGYDLSRNHSASVSLAWSRSLVEGADDPADIFFDFKWLITRTFSFTPFASFGLTDGSPDFGVGFQTSWRFGRR